MFIQSTNKVYKWIIGGAAGHVRVKNLDAGADQGSGPVVPWLAPLQLPPRVYSVLVWCFAVPHSYEYACMSP